MKLVLRNDKVAVYDSVLPDADFENVWIQAQNDQYQAPAKAGAWIKVWRLNDGAPVQGTEHLYSRRPLRNAFDPLLDAVAAVARSHAELIGAEGQAWNDITLRPYLYPRGTKLSWHEDTGRKAGSYTFYAHPNWGSTWGGELLIAETAGAEFMRAGLRAGPYLDHGAEDRYVLDAGHGQFIAAKPNRLVILAGGAYHAINRVDSDAGDQVRCSISGFFVVPNAGKPAAAPR